MKSIFILALSCTLAVSAQEKVCDSPTSKDRFTLIYKDISSKKTDNIRYRFIKDYMSRECVSTEQLIEFFNLLDEHKLKVSLTHEVYDFLYDPENLSNVTKGFSEWERKVVDKNIKK